MTSMFMLTMLLLVLGIVILIALFVYNDAKKNNMPALPWALAAAFIPNFMGIVIYLLCRGDKVLKCPECGSRIKESFRLCPYCGKTLDYKNIDTDRQSTGIGKWIIVTIILVLISFMIFILSINHMGIPLAANNNVSYMCVEKNTSKAWENKYKMLNGKQYKMLRPKTDTEMELSYDSSVEEGSLNIFIEDVEGNLVKDIPMNMAGKDTIKLKGGENYRIVVKAAKTKGYYKLNWSYLDN